MSETIPIRIIRQGEDAFYKFRFKNEIDNYENIYLLIKDDKEKVTETFSLFPCTGCTTGYLSEDPNDPKAIIFHLKNSFTLKLSEGLYIYELKIKLIKPGGNIHGIFEEKFFTIKNSKTRTL